MVIMHETDAEKRFPTRGHYARDGESDSVALSILMFLSRPTSQGLSHPKKKKIWRKSEKVQKQKRRPSQFDAEESHLKRTASGQYVQQHRKNTGELKR